MFSKEDYLYYYYLENYIFMTIKDNFNQSHRLNAFDFYCILDWFDTKNADKIKNHILNNINKHNTPKRFKSNFDYTVKNLTRVIYNTNDNKEKLRLLIVDWKINTQLSILILSILYPYEFAFFSPIVCNILFKNKNDISKLLSLKKFDDIWAVYNEYLKKLNKVAPMHKDLNDKARWLIGKERVIKIKNGIK